MGQRFLNKYWWENQLKYQPLAQRAFLFFSLSSRFPAMLNIEPTNLCNLNCVFCPIQKTNRQKGFMDLRLFQRIIDQVSNMKKIKVLWLNKDGEPLLHPEVDKMVGYAKKKKVADRVEIYTNGVLLDKPMARKLIEAELDSLVISVDATNPESFKKLKGKDDYNQVVTNIKEFCKVRSGLGAQKPLLTVKTVNLGDPQEISKFKKLWKSIADCVVVQPLHTWEGSIKKYQISNIKYQKLGRWACNLPWLAPAINWDGTVVPCCVNYKKNELILGDVKDQSLAEIFSGRKFKALREAHLKQEFSNFPTCARCQYWQQLPSMDFWLKRIGI